MKWQEVSKIAKDNGFVEEYDENLECPVLDEDKVSEWKKRESPPNTIGLYKYFNTFWFTQLMDFLEPEMASGGNIVEYHSCEFFPERWFDAVFVILCNNTILYDRLQQRGYNEKKIKENISCEIFQEILNEAKESYADDIVYELSGETDVNFIDSINQITDFIENFKQ